MSPERDSPPLIRSGPKYRTGRMTFKKKEKDSSPHGFKCKALIERESKSTLKRQEESALRRSTTASSEKKTSYLDISGDSLEDLCKGKNRKKSVKKSSVEELYEDMSVESLLVNLQEKNTADLQEKNTADLQEKNTADTVVFPMMGLGVGVACVRENRAELDAAHISTLLTLQHEDGFWELCSGLDQSLGINSDTCKNMLFCAGLKSLGTSVADEMLHLLATLLVILSILEGLCPELFPLSFNSLLEYSSHKDQFRQVRKGIREKLLTPKLQESLSRGIDVCLDTDRKHPLVCRSLELGPDWVSVTAQLLGLKKQQGTMAISGLKTLYMLLDDLGILQTKVNVQ